VNGQRIRARRLELGLSVTALAGQLGLATDTVHAIETGTLTHPAGVSLGAVLGLAQALGLAPADLFDDSAPGQAAQPTPAPSAAAPDDRALEAVLLAHGDAVTLDDLAEALGWPLGRLEAALHALHRRLEPTGARLTRTGWNRYRIDSDQQALTSRQRHALAQRHRADDHDGLSVAAAAKLYLLSTGVPAQLQQQLWHDDPVAKRLARQRLATGGPPYDLTPEVRFSLGLQEVIDTNLS
jgi:transcriptional regulator with XRE-family HTH domain